MPPYFLCFSIGLWVDCGWTVGGLWVDCGWTVGGLWVDCGWTVGGLWAAYLYCNLSAIGAGGQQCHRVGVVVLLAELHL